MIFQNNILHAFQNWKFNNAQLNGNTVTIKPNGTIQCVIYPKNNNETKINERYKVIVNQGENKGKLSFTFTNYLSNNDIKKSSIVIYSNDDIDKIVKTESNTTRQMVVTIENLSEDSINIVNVELKPSSDISSDIKEELTKYATHIVKYTNFDSFTITSEKSLIANLNVELMEKSNLLLHLLLNGASTCIANLTLYITINGEDLEYSPLTVTTQNGNLLIGIPGNIMNIPEGESRVKIYASVDNGIITVQPKRLQFTLDGQNMVVIYGEDIWFGPSEDNDFNPCENEVFTFNNDLVEITGGRLKCKYIEGYIEPMNLKVKCNFGDIYSFNFSEPNVRKYENIEII